jgi:hypothetical protein
MKRSKNSPVAPSATIQAKEGARRPVPDVPPAKGSVADDKYIARSAKMGRSDSMRAETSAVLNSGSSFTGIVRRALGPTG